jgi:succinate-semialdehyde dehydrogenase/glutarate-semialdehyde dehydrogenase
VPAGVVNVIPTDRSREAAAAVISDPRLRKLSFTGSTEVGRALLVQAAHGILRTSMELGGNAPFVVFEDADLDAALDGAMLAKFRNIGQACTAANRFLVQESVAEEFARRLAGRVRSLRVGPGDQSGTQIGPLINGQAVDSMTELVRDAVARGGRLLAGGGALDGPGHFFAPTVIADLTGDAGMVREEIFGPLVGIQTFRDEADAVALANDTEVGLAGYIYTQDLARAHRLIEAVEVGMMAINSGLVSNAAAPFGGIKQSGLGREGGLEGIDEYLETKYTLIASTQRTP